MLMTFTAPWNDADIQAEITRLHVKNAQSARVIWRGEQEQGK